MVDALEGVLGIEWIDGKSVRFLLGGGAEGEEEAIDDTEEFLPEPEEPEEEPLTEYGVDKGLLTHLQLTGYDSCVSGSRYTDVYDRHRDRENAPSRHHSRRSNYI